MENKKDYTMSDIITLINARLDSLEDQIRMNITEQNKKIDNIQGDVKDNCEKTEKTLAEMTKKNDKRFKINVGLSCMVLGMVVTIPAESLGKLVQVVIQAFGG